MCHAVGAVIRDILPVSLKTFPRCSRVAGRFSQTSKAARDRRQVPNGDSHAPGGTVPSPREGLGPASGGMFQQPQAGPEPWVPLPAGVAGWAPGSAVGWAGWAPAWAAASSAGWAG